MENAEFSIDSTIYDSPPLLTIITRRHPDRPRFFERLQSSIAAQTNRKIQHVCMNDLVGMGVPGANRMLAHESATRCIEGEYVQVIDDDDVIDSRDFVERLKAFVEESARPKWIMVKGYVLNHGVYPRPWGDPWLPEPCSAASFSIITRADVWAKYHGAWAVDGQGDTVFARELWKAGIQPLWFDFLACRTQRVSRGRPE